MRHDWAQDPLFRAAWAYELAFAWEVEDEISVVLRLAGLRAADGGRLLVPACGTGRHAAAFAKLGFFVDAFDINPQMLELARTRRPDARIAYGLGDMGLAPAGHAHDCAAAFTFTNSFRYLLTDESIAGHFALLANRLGPRSRYVCELALNPVPEQVGKRMKWAVEHADCRVEACWTLEGLRFPLSDERAVIRVERAGQAPVEVEALQPQRLWTGPLLEAAAHTAGLSLTGLFDPKGVRTDGTRPGRYYAVFERSP